MNIIGAVLAAAILASPAFPAPAQPVTSRQGMVVSSQHYASDVGARVLAQGGNAIDAAVAVGYALAVTHPCCGNLGGGGFMLIHTAEGRDTVIDFREAAPLAADRNMFLNDKGEVVGRKSLDGYLAAGAPGTVAGLEYARTHFGTRSRARLIAPSVALARDGFVLDPGDVAILEPATARLAADPEAGRIFLNHGRPYRAGERLVQADLAAVLKRIAAEGPDAFYRGAIPRAVAEASRAHGGRLTEADFAAYRVKIREPVRCAYRGREIIVPPPPSSGGVTICEMFGLLSRFSPEQLQPGTAEAVHLWAEAARRAYFDRNTTLGDPDFVQDPTKRLLAPARLGALSAGIDPDRATPSSSLGAAEPPENHQTTHYSVVDRQGNAVAVTYTINDDFGAKVVAPGTGFLLNDEMDDFAVKPGSPNVYGLVQGEANAVGPGKRPLSSMSPAIVLKDGRLDMVIGSPGGSRIITTVAGVMLDIIDGGWDPQRAADAPRWHHQWLPDEIDLERGALAPAEMAKLRAMGHRVGTMPDWGSGNSVEMITARWDGAARPLLRGVNDRRAPAGSAAAPSGISASGKP